MFLPLIGQAIDVEKRRFAFQSGANPSKLRGGRRKKHCAGWGGVKRKESKRHSGQFRHQLGQFAGLEFLQQAGAVDLDRAIAEAQFQPHLF